MNPHKKALSNLIDQIQAMKERSEKYEREELSEGRLGEAEKHFRVLCALKELERLGIAFQQEANGTE